MEVKINKEIRNYTESMFFGLSLRQFIFSVLACGVAVGLYFLLRPRFGTETLSWVCILGAFPFAAMGFIKYNGMTAEQFVCVRDGVYHDVERCAEETRALLALPQRPTCIIFPDDFSALGGYNALTEAGLSIPEDISVMGYDGIYLSRVVKPPLVTYQQNTKSLGRLAADKLIELIEHPRVTLPEQIRVSGKLLDGGSVRIL